jgi:hypothetical protein
MKKVLFLLSVIFSACAAMGQVFDYVLITDDVQDGGTKATVTLTLYGSSSTYEQKMTGGFERGSWVHGVIFSNSPNMGTIDSIRVQHNDSAASPDWKFGALALKSRSTGAVSVFMFDDWIASNHGTGCKTAIVIRRSPYGWKLFKAPFNEQYSEKAAEPPVTAKGIASANKTTGGVAFYCDAGLGGANATAEVGPGFSTSTPGKVFVRTEIVYTGGLVNAFLASFSELDFSRHINGARSLTTMQPAFTGQTVFDKVIGVASVVSGLGVLGAGKAVDVIEAISTCNDILGLMNGIEQLADAGKAKTYSTMFVFDSRNGYNKCTVGFKGVTAAVATGSSIGIVCGVVKSIEMIGGIAAAESAPPPPTAQFEPSGMPAAGSGMSPHTIKPK